MANSDQIQLFDTYRFPKTRYQGSKYKLRSWIGDQLSKIEFDTALDAFSGTCSISYTMKEMGKQVTCNDIGWLRRNSVFRWRSGRYRRDTFVCFTESNGTYHEFPTVADYLSFYEKSGRQY